MKVSSFEVDHDRLLQGVYVSRIDEVGAEKVTTFDLRMKVPNCEDVLSNGGIHTIEHLMAVYLRTKAGSFSDQVLYVGPMGCRTGMYLILKGLCEPKDIIEILIKLFEHIENFEGAVPATTSIECGNYRDHNLEDAKKEAKAYLEVLRNITEENMVYPK
ncbi:MAG: S-ribosylhomocysteine lyase [Lachnospirales bacterium]